MNNGTEKLTAKKKASLAIGVGAMVLLTGILSIGILSAQQAAAQMQGNQTGNQTGPGGAQKPPGTPPTTPPAKPPTPSKAFDIAPDIPQA
jgi:hypothetical protein